MTKIIFLNGAPRAGKDCCASAIVKEYHSAHRLGFADHLKRATHAAYGMFDVPAFYFENVKDQPNDLFLGLSPRQAYIKHSESYMKPIHGDKVFGDLWLRGAQALPSPEIIAVPDSGFAPEAEPGINWVGPDNCMLIRVRRDGCDFSNDSRSHIDLPVHTVEIWNNSTLADLHNALQCEIDGWLNG